MSELLAKISQPKNPAPVRDGITDFLQRHYVMKSDARRLGNIERTAVSPGIMHPQTRAVVMIPAHHSEMNLGRTLTEYAKQTSIGHRNGEQKKETKVELVLLINGKKKEVPDLTQTRAYTDARRFVDSHFPIPLTLAHADYPEGSTIGRIRRDLVALSVKRALLAPGVDIDNLILITNDADLQRIPGNYLSSIISSFDANPQQAGLTGFIDYPKLDFDKDHVFHFTQRFYDILEVIRRRRHHRVTMRAGNSAFRLKDYIETGGIKTSSHTSELRPVYKALREKNPSSVVYHERRKGMNIETSGRRQLTANRNGVLFVNRYDNFGYETDIAGNWKKPEDEFVLPEYAMQYTNEHFFATIQAQLDGMYRKLAHVYPMEIGTIQKQMKLAGVLSGIRLNFVKMSRERKEQKGLSSHTASSQEVEILDISKLREGMRKAHNRY